METKSETIFVVSRSILACSKFVYTVPIIRYPMSMYLSQVIGKTRYSLVLWVHLIVIFYQSSRFARVNYKIKELL